MIAFLGAGHSATALAIVLAKRPKPIALYSIEPTVTRSINETHRNDKYLPDSVCPDNIFATDSLEEALKGAHFIFVALPSSAIAEVLSSAHRFIEPHAIIISITKGIDPETFRPLILEQMGVIPQELQTRFVILGGPTIASELASEQATAFIVASEDPEASEEVRQALSHARVHISLTQDVLGVGLCSAFKHAYAIALGFCDGLHVSANTKGFIFTMALQEMADLVEAGGGQRATTFTIAGAGDLFVSGISAYGKNRTYGEKLIASQSKNPEDFHLFGVEGIAITKTAFLIARHHGIKTPLLDVIYECLSKESDFSLPFEKYLRERDS